MSDRSSPVFIAFAGLPGTGKSTIARELARRLDAVYLRIDTIEQAIRSSGSPASGADVGPAGYVVAYRIAAENLRLGRTVIADSVNPLEITRDAYRSVALESAARFLEIEVVCSDAAIHRQRIRNRTTDVEDLVAPTWEEVQAYRYDVWRRPRMELDTASLSIEDSMRKIVAALPAATSPDLQTRDHDGVNAPLP